MSGESEISRRDFFKAAPWLAAAGATASKAKKEVSVITSGVFENEGAKYQPIYEQHIQGPEIPLNPQTNGLFLERSQGHKVVKRHADGTFETKKYTHYDMDINTLIELLSKTPGRKEMIEKATKMRIPIAFGDVATNDIQETMDMFRFTTDEDKKNLWRITSRCLKFLSRRIPENNGKKSKKYNDKETISYKERSIADNSTWNCLWRLAKY